MDDDDEEDRGLWVDFGVHLDARCRDCGAEIPDFETRLKDPDVAPVSVPCEGDASEMHLAKRGACEACGSGRVRIRVDFAVGG